MKKIILSAFALIMAVSMQAQTLDEIIAKNIAARGGMEKIKKLKTLINECTINAQGADMPIKFTIAHKRGFRMDFTVMGMDNYMFCNTKAGYGYSPIQGQKAPEALPADAVKGMQPQFDMEGEFINTKEKGITLTLQGEEDVDGTKCFKILCINADKSEKRIFIDNESFQIIKEVSKVNVNGKDTEVSQEFSNFQATDGYTIPMEFSSPYGNIKIKKAIFNSEIPDSTFELKK